MQSVYDKIFLRSIREKIMNFDKQVIIDSINKLADKKVLIIGDLALD